MPNHLMRPIRRSWYLAPLLGLIALGCIPLHLGSRRVLAQSTDATPEVLPDTGASAPVAGDSADSARGSLPVGERDGTSEAAPHYRNHADSLTAVRTRHASARAPGRRVVVSLAERRLWVLDGHDTLRSAPIAVGMGRELEYGGRRWLFETPRGVRVVQGKRSAPLWRPPDWLYAEAAQENHLRLARLTRNRPVTLSDGRKLVVRDSLVGLLLADGFAALPVDEHIVFDSTLFVPPLATKNRHVEGELGQFQLDLGNGYLLHGTPRVESIGTASTHGCVRLGDEDIAWLYDNVPVGTRVFIY
jgi:L,D-transpeptidase-like protein